MIANLSRHLLRKQLSALTCDILALIAAFEGSVDVALTSAWNKSFSDLVCIEKAALTL